MQELTFEQVESVSGGSKIDEGRRRMQERQAAGELAEGKCKIVDGAFGGFVGSKFGTFFNLSNSMFTAGGIGAGLAFMTPCGTFMEGDLTNHLQQSARICIDNSGANDAFCNR